ncbi:hypothetical protein DMENIID0001_103860 [Sergentomyia squamirostris]
MAAVDVMCVSDVSQVWNNNRDTIEDRLSFFICNEFLSDMTFLVGAEKRRVPGHKFILSTCSWEFYNALHLLQVDNNELPIQDVTYEIFLFFLRYCYTGKVDLTPESAISVMKLAQRFNMQHLMKICEESIEKMISSKTCLLLYSQCSYLSSESGLRRKILDTIAENFFCLIQDRTLMKIFVELPLKSIREIASLDHLQCDEMELFDALMRWAGHTCQKYQVASIPRNLRQILCDVFYKIRFPDMKVEWFLEVQAKYPELFTFSEISDICLKMRGDVKTCPKFTSPPRRFDSKIIRSSMNLSNFSTGKIIPCFRETIEMRDDATMELAICFQPQLSAQNVYQPGKHLLGFAVIVRKGQEVSPSACSLENRNVQGGLFAVPPSTLRNTRLGQRYRLNWDYDIAFIQFESKALINELRPYELRCKFHSGLPQPKTEASLQNTNTYVSLRRIKEDHIIPYLHFE